jgi:type VI secretion system secreted protein Hcp
MPIPLYAIIDGANGKIDGSCDQEGHKDEILVQAFISDFEIPKSPQTGLPTGRAAPKPLMITKEVDKSTPLLYQALAKGEQLKTVTFNFFRINAQGKEEKYYTVKLERAIVVQIRSHIQYVKDPKYSQMGNMEDVFFAYGKITETQVIDGIEADFDYENPPQ